MIVGAAAESPVKFPLRLADWHIVDAGKSTLHQSLRIELPVFVSIRPKPAAAVVMPLVSKPHGDPIAVMCPDLRDQPVVQLPCPFTGEESHDLSPAVDELSTVSPLAVGGINERHFSGLRLFHPSPALRTFWVGGFECEGGQQTRRGNLLHEFVPIDFYCTDQYSFGKRAGLAAAVIDPIAAR